MENFLGWYVNGKARESMFREKTETVEFISKQENIVVKWNSRNLEAFNNSRNQPLPNFYHSRSLEFRNRHRKSECLVEKLVCFETSNLKTDLIIVIKISKIHNEILQTELFAKSKISLQKFLFRSVTYLIKFLLQRFFLFISSYKIQDTLYLREYRDLWQKFFSSFPCYFVALAGNLQPPLQIQIIFYIVLSIANLCSGLPD